MEWEVAFPIHGKGKEHCLSSQVQSLQLNAQDGDQQLSIGVF
jgi:hypothetical protein